MSRTIRSTSYVASRALLALGEGVFAHSVDAVLWLTVYLAELSVPFQAHANPWRAQIRADRFLQETNYDVIKHAMVTARRNRWIKRIGRHAMPEITVAGKRRLANALPKYDEKRLWDGRMHMVTYDIPEQRASDRRLLRDYLRRIGCGLLQKSVWITPYNPVDLVRFFVKDRGLAGTVIVSDLGKDGAIGEEDVRGMVVRVYGLWELNDRYNAWLDEWRRGTTDHWAVLHFFSVLRDDPQLPFALLPGWWKGGVAYDQVKPILQTLTF